MNKVWEIPRRFKTMRSQSPETCANVQGDEQNVEVKEEVAAIGAATLSLLVVGAGAFAQKHFMLSSALRPEVKMQLPHPSYAIPRA